MTTFNKEKIIVAYQDAPDLVREAFNSEQTVATIRDIRTRYNLHVDTAGTLGENVGFMLIGLLSPSEFFGEMVLSGVDQDTAKSVLEALNTRIFIPLRDRIKHGGSLETIKEPPITYSGPSAPVRKPKQDAQLLPFAVTSRVEASTTEDLDNIKEKPSFNLIPAVVREPPIRTMASDIALLKEVDLRVKNSPQTTTQTLTQNLQPEHATPARFFQTASIPVQVSSPAYTPIYVPAKTVLNSLPNIVTENVPRTVRESASINNASLDPYRESV